MMNIDNTTILLLTIMHKKSETFSPFAPPEATTAEQTT